MMKKSYTSALNFAQKAQNRLHWGLVLTDGPALTKRAAEFLKCVHRRKTMIVRVTVSAAPGDCGTFSARRVSDLEDRLGCVAQT